MRRRIALTTTLGLAGAGALLALVPPSASAQPYHYHKKKQYHRYYGPPPRRYYRPRRSYYATPGVGFFGLTFNFSNAFRSRPEVQYGNWQSVPERQADPLVRDVQDRLARLGYPVGEVDGYYGPQTATALRQFQNDAGLPVNGRISDDVVAALGAQSNAGPGGPIPALAFLSMEVNSPRERGKNGVAKPPPKARLSAKLSADSGNERQVRL